MYQLDYSPDRLDDWNEYFVRYNGSKDIKWFNEFLYFYEPILENNARKFIKKYELEEYRLDDLKQIFSFVLWSELQTYQSDIPLLQMIKYKELNAWHDYVRLNCGNFQLDNRYQYLLLRKVALLYYRKRNVEKTLNEIVIEIANELKMTKEVVENYIIAVTTFKPKYNIDFYVDDEDDSYSATINSISGECSAETEFFKFQQKEKLIAALGKLTKTEQILLENKFGICIDCLGNRPKSTLRSISMSLDLTESGVEKKLKSILKKLKNLLQE